MTMILPGIAALMAAGPALGEMPVSRGGWIAEVQGRDGAARGTLTVEPAASGTRVAALDLAGLPTDRRRCICPGPAIARPRISPPPAGLSRGEASHGVESADGPHPGDLPNVIPDTGGAVQVKFFNERLTAGMMGDDDGAAFVVHDGADDWRDRPGGRPGRADRLRRVPAAGSDRGGPAGTMSVRPGSRRRRVRVSAGGGRGPRRTDP